MRHRWGSLALVFVLMLGCATADTLVAPPVPTVELTGVPVRVVLPTERPTETIAATATALPSATPLATVKPSGAPSRTATARPSATKPPSPTLAPTQAPTARVLPGATVSNVRVGAICNDGTRSSATGSGACSHHGGVREWLYR